MWKPCIVFLAVLSITSLGQSWQAEGAPEPEEGSGLADEIEPRFGESEPKPEPAESKPEQKPESEFSAGQAAASGLALLAADQVAL